jgi:hypothetical protein
MKLDSLYVFGLVFASIMILFYIAMLIWMLGIMVHDKIKGDSDNERR